LNWRTKQERMNKSNLIIQKKMNKKNIIAFIQHYEKLTKWMLNTVPMKSNIVIQVDKKQRITSIKLR